MGKRDILRKIKARLPKLSDVSNDSAQLEPKQPVTQRPEPAKPIVEGEKTIRIALPTKRPVVRAKADYLEKLRSVDESNPLITMKVKNQVLPLAYARIKFDT